MGDEEQDRLPPQRCRKVERQEWWVVFCLWILALATMAILYFLGRR